MSGFRVKRGRGQRRSRRMKNAVHYSTQMVGFNYLHTVCPFSDATLRIIFAAKGRSWR